MPVICLKAGEFMGVDGGEVEGMKEEKGNQNICPQPHLLQYFKPW